MASFSYGPLSPVFGSYDEHSHGMEVKMPAQEWPEQNTSFDRVKIFRFDLKMDLAGMEIASEDFMADFRTVIELYKEINQVAAMARNSKLKDFMDKLIADCYMATTLEVKDDFADEQLRRYRTMEAASMRLQKEAKGYLDSLRGVHAQVEIRVWADLRSYDCFPNANR